MARSSGGGMRRCPVLRLSATHQRAPVMPGLASTSALRVEPHPGALGSSHMCHMRTQLAWMDTCACVDEHVRCSMCNALLI